MWRVGRFAPSNRVDDYYLFVGRLVPYRRLDVLIEAFNKMGRPLKIAGSGRDRERLEALAGPTVEFLGFVPDADLFQADRLRLRNPADAAVNLVSLF